MKRLLATTTIAVVAAFAGTGAAWGDRGDHGKPFFFSANCTGLGDVILENIGLSHNAALRVLGSNVVVVAPIGSVGGARGIENAPPASGTTCTFTGGGFSLTDIQPFEEPFTVPVLIAP